MIFICNPLDINMENKITQLEIEIMHHESSIDELTRTVLEQGKLIKQLQQEIKNIQNQLKELSKEYFNIAPVSEETPPPHY